MKLVPQKVTRTIGRQKLTIQRNSPHILFVGGLIGVVASTILACRATLKLEEKLDEIKTDFTDIKEMKEHALNEDVEYSDKQHTKDVTYVCFKSAKTIGKLYGPSIALGIVSISALSGAHIQMTKRNTALTATLGLVSKAYDDYRTRVQEELGVEKELDIYRSLKEKEIENSDKKKELVKVLDPSGLSPYARIFDECSTEWRKDAELNRIYIHCQQEYANHLLRARGHVFLNEVYDSLGFERTHAGAVVGWILNGEASDNYIDFGLYEASNARFVNALERSVILDFNVDGVIFDKF